ncbi:hypothetical protein BH09PSE2_BH09PSE2_07900 [soil metagenome]
MTSYRIAFVNPYATAAEVQAFESLQRAAEAQGITLEHRKPKDLREDDAYDFVIPVAFTPKTTSHPSLLSCHSPRAVYVDSEEMFGAIASHEGYLTISDNLQTFFGSLCAGWGKALTGTGYYYNCPQRTEITTDIAGLANSGDLALCYFGINWDMRAEPLFRALSQKPYMRVYGPADSWRTVRPETYKGQLPFDGSSVQNEYARFGVGLICLGYEHLMDDIISNRVFEISSVGAASISPDTPWMRRNFGDSVLYYDPFSSIEVIVEQIDAAFRAIQADPIAAAERAAKARSIFEERFHAGAMLQGAVEHFERWKAASAPPPAVAQAKIDVIVRGRGEGFAETLASIRRQRAGRLRVLVIGDAFESDPDIESFPDLPSALAAVTAPAFAILTAGERLLSHHFERLLPPVIFGGAAMAYADALAPDAADAGELKICAQGPAGGAVSEVLRRLPLACLLMSRPMADGLLGWRGLVEADDHAVVARLLAGGRAEHRPSPTCILPVAPPPPPEDLERRLALGIEAAPFLAALRLNAPERRPSLLRPIADAVGDIGEAKLDAIAPQRVFEGGMIGSDVSDRTELVHVDIPLAANRLTAITPWTQGEAGVIRFLPAAAFDIALRVDIGDYVLPGCRPSVVFGLEGAEDTLFLGLLDAQGEIVARTITPKSRKPLKVWVTSLFGEPPVEAIVQAWKRAPSEPVGLVSVTLAYKLAELAAACGRPDLTRAEALLLLTDRARTEVVGAPLEGHPLVPIDLHDSRSSFRKLLEPGSEGEGRERVVGTGEIPWDYFGQIFVPRTEQATAVKLELERVREPFSAFLTNTAFDQVVSPVLKLRADKDATTVWLPLPAEADDLYLVLQAQEAPQNGEVTLRRLSLAVDGTQAPPPL